MTAMKRAGAGFRPEISREGEVSLPFIQLANSGNHSTWRKFAAYRIAMAMDYEAFGVKGIYLIGSAETGEAGIGSDIDLLIHVDGNGEKQRLLRLWLDGWSKSLALINYLRTGYMAGDLLDIHLVTDEDVGNGDSFAVKMKFPTESCSLICRS